MRSTGPLVGCRVVELAHIMAGPVCGRMLADLGADVVKVEPTGSGDAVRQFLPPAVGEESAAFLMLNRNKRGISVDWKTEGGREVVARLLSDADVVIENFRPGTMERMGFGYPALREKNPRLIYCQITGFGSTGPLAGLAGFDLIAQGYSGLMSITGEGPDGPPVKCGPPITDITAGILGALGVLAAYLERFRSGRGQLVDTSLFEAGVTQTFWQSAIALATGRSPGPLGSAHPLAAPYQAFQTSDGWITVGGSSPTAWARLTEALGLPEMQADPRFARNEDRMAHLDELLELLAPRFLAESSAVWLARLEEAGVPAGPVASVGDMLSHPHTQAREMVITTEHATLGPVETLGFPVKLSETPADVRTAAPLLGQHTREVLLELGYTEVEVTSLLESGSAQSPD